MKYKLYLLSTLLVLLLGHTSFAADLFVFAGAGMRVPLTELGQNFTEETGIKVIYDFAGSGRLGGKILLGIKPDLFIPGSEKWALRLKQEGYVKECIAVAYHTPVLISPHGNHKVKSLNDLTNKAYKIALGDGEACAIGRNNKRMFQAAGLDPAEMNVVARGVSVKQLVQWVETGTVDASIVWRADAFQSGQVEVVELPASINPIDSIPLCQMTQPSNSKEAFMFWKYLLENSATVFFKHGFQTIQLK